MASPTAKAEFLITFRQLQFGGFFFIQNTVFHPEHGLSGGSGTIKSTVSPTP